MSRATPRFPSPHRLRAQDGFTMLLALGILTITMLLTGALLLAVVSDAHLTHDDLDGKRAYAAAQAGLQAYLFNLDHNSAASKWWQTCSNDSGGATVPGNSDESYTFQPVVACSPTNPVGTVLDPTTGQLRIEFTGTSATATRTVVAAFRTLSPLSYLWYTVYETVDPVTGGPDCARFYWQTPGPPRSCEIEWVSGDKVNGPMYTQDEYLIAGQPTFGLSSADAIASSAPTDHVCVGDAGNGAVPETCPVGVLVGTEDPHATLIPLPADNSSLETDAASNGVVLPAGTTTLAISGLLAKAVTCTTALTSSCSSQTLNLTKDPVIYAANAPGCVSSYDPSNVPAPATVTAKQASPYNGIAYGLCGDVYLQASSYSSSLTIAAENDIIVGGDVLDASADANGDPTGTATLGLVADQYVRVYHPATGQGRSSCKSANTSVTIDAAILALQHSFFVDNYECGGPSFGTLTVNGAIAQKYRGIVGNAGGTYGGYLKAYSYDTRLAYQLPPYMFDLQDASWQILRETLCAIGQPATSPQSCLYQGIGS
jgi:hypothetical protein